MQIRINKRCERKASAINLEWAICPGLMSETSGKFYGAKNCIEEYRCKLSALPWTTYCSTCGDGRNKQDNLSIQDTACSDQNNVSLRTWEMGEVGVQHS